MYSKMQMINLDHPYFRSCFVGLFLHSGMYFDHVDFNFILSPQKLILENSIFVFERVTWMFSIVFFFKGMLNTF